MGIYHGDERLDDPHFGRLDGLKPLTFPDRPVMPVGVAVFDDSSLARPRRDCPWAWTAALLAVLFIIVLGVLR